MQSLKLCSLVLGSVCLFSFVAKAQANDVRQQSPFTGIYTSAGLGIGSTQFEMNNSSSFASSGVGALTATSQISNNAQTLSALGELELGYGYVFPRQVYLGAVGFVDFADHSNSNTLNLVNNLGAGSFIRDLKSNTTKLDTVTGGFAIKPGFLVAPKTLFYGILGWEGADAVINASQSVQITTAARGSQSASSQQNVNALRVGVGFSQQVGQAVMVGVRYVYSNYFASPSVSTPVVNTTGGLLSGPFSYTVGNKQITSQAVMADVSYYWGQRPEFTRLPAVVAQDFNGFYVAPQIGALNPSVEGNQSTVFVSYVGRGAFTNQPQLTTAVPGNSAATLLDLAFGFGKVFKERLYMALEGSVDWASNSINEQVFHGFRPTSVAVAGQVQDAIQHQSNVSMWNFQPNFDVKVGVIMMRRLLAYVSAGVAINDLSLSARDQITYLDLASTSQTFNLNSNASSGSYANLRIGAGLEFQFIAHNAFTLNYIYTYYGTFNLHRTMTATDGSGNPVTISENASVKLANNAVTIGYTYFF